MTTLLHSLGITLPLLLEQIAGFIVFAVLFWRFAQKPLLNLLDQRQADIQSTYDQLDADREEMVNTRNDYEKRLADIEAEARERIQEAVKEAQSLRDQIIVEARQQAESIVEQGRTESLREREKVFTEMRRDIVALSISVAGKVVGEKLDAQRHARLVDDFIDLVGSGSIERIGQNGTGAR
ncbi:MAG: F0F1 ATP synthase subunit B [Capsulimonadaceae bacterium]